MIQDIWRIHRLLRFGYPWMIVWAIGIHINTGIFMILNNRVVTLLPFIGLKEFSNIGIPVNVIAVILIAVGALAAIGLVLDINDQLKPRVILLLMLPQYGLMIAAFLSDLRILINIHDVRTATGASVDFTIAEPLAFLIMFAAFLHTLSIIEKFVLEPKDPVVKAIQNDPIRSPSY